MSGPIPEEFGFEFIPYRYVELSLLYILALGLCWKSLTRHFALSRWLYGSDKGFRYALGMVRAGSNAIIKESDARRDGRQRGGYELW